ncbi:malic enzyme, partial [Helicosporidium sp. ATCC 50920]
MHCVRASHSYSPEDEEDVELSEVVTPWASSVLTGSDLIRASKYNKGLAFSHAEREKLYLRGLLPPAELSQELQSERVMANVRETKREVDRLQYLLSLGERNEQLFHYVLAAHLAEILPLLEHPTTAACCQKYSLMFRALPRALYVTSEDAGSVDSILRNWPERDVRVVCVTDGQECGPLGDLGVQAIGTPLSRLALYTAAGGVRPASCLPVVLDVGTDNARLLADPIYVGLKKRRDAGEAVEELRDELVASLRARYGPALLLDCEDMRYATAEAFVEACQGLFPAYSDAVHGFPAVVLAAVLAALPSTHSPRLADHTFLFVGEGPELLAVVRLVEEAVLAQGGALGTVWDIRERIALVDAKGLVVRERPDAEDYADGVLPYARDLPPAESLLQAVRAVKPTVLVGLTRGAR